MFIGGRATATFAKLTTFTISFIPSEFNETPNNKGQNYKLSKIGKPKQIYVNKAKLLELLVINQLRDKSVKA